MTKVSKWVEEILAPPTMAPRLMLYNSHVVSLMMYKAQLAPLSREAAHTATQALQRTTKAPWQSIPNEVLHCAHGLQLRARAPAMTGAVRSTVEGGLRSSACRTPLRLIRGYLGMAPQTCHCFGAHRAAQARPREVCSQLQERAVSKVIALMRGTADERRARVAVVLRRRAVRWTEDPGAMVGRLASMHQTCLPSELAMGFWRFFLFTWCTFARFAQQVVESRICGELNVDRQQHYPSCPESRRWLRRFGLGAQPEDAAMPGCLSKGCLAGPECSVNFMSALAALSSAYDSTWHAIRCAIQSLRTVRLKQIWRRHVVFREVARSLLAP